MRVGDMSVIRATVENTGDQVTRDVEVSLSGPIKGKLAEHTNDLKPGTRREVLLNVQPAAGGEIVVTCNVAFTDARGFRHEKADTVVLSVARREEPPKSQQIINITSENFAMGGTIAKTTQDYRGATIDQRTQTVQGSIIEGNYSQDTVQGDKVADGAVSLKDSVVKGDVSSGAEGQAAQDKSGGASDIKSRLLQLKELFELDAIDEDEYKARKAKILEEI
jgi:hypothetical protein